MSPVTEQDDDHSGDGMDSGDDTDSEGSFVTHEELHDGWEDDDNIITTETTTAETTTAETTTAETTTAETTTAETTTAETTKHQATGTQTLDHKSPLGNLPPELILNIIEFLPTVDDLTRLIRTCKWFSTSDLKDIVLRTALTRHNTYHTFRQNPFEWPLLLEKILLGAINQSNPAQILGRIKNHLDGKPRGADNNPLFQINRPFVHTTTLTMLELAAKHGDIQLAEWLLLHGAKPNAGSQKPLQLAIQRAVDSGGIICPCGIARLLINEGANTIEPSKELVKLSRCVVHGPGVDCLLSLGQTFLRSPDFERYEGERPRIENWLRLLRGETSYESSFAQVTKSGKWDWERGGVF
ncbi:hypothetical protein V8F33_006239 [Rhypophila sp. PSN 637]